MDIINLYVSFKKIGGAQLVAYNLFNSLKFTNNSFIGSFDKFNQINKRYSIKSSLYIQLSTNNIKKFNNLIILSHHRKITSFVMVLLKLGLINCTLIHVAHNVFNSLKNLSFFPENIIAVSNSVKKNLVNYFQIVSGNIKVIYNGVEDIYRKSNTSLDNNDLIDILYPATVNKIKGQVELVKKLKGNLNPKIRITFCGDGDDINLLKQICNGCNNFIVKGYCNNIYDTLYATKYILLFSQKEGLPLSLIEATMFGIPIICNDVGGNKEIVVDNYNGFINNTYPELIELINNTVNFSKEKYMNLSVNSRSIYERKFKYSTMYNNYSSYLTKIANKL